jgi:VanZ family protein
MSRFFKVPYLGFRTALLVLPLYWLVLAVATHLPVVRIPRVAGGDKSIHFFAFAALAFLITWALPNILKLRWNLLIGATIAIVYGAIDEFTQIPVGRTADVADWYADSVGAVFGVLVFAVVRFTWVRVRHSLNGRSQPVRVS